MIMGLQVAQTREMGDSEEAHVQWVSVCPLSTRKELCMTRIVY